MKFIYSRLLPLVLIVSFSHSAIADHPNQGALPSKGPGPEDVFCKQVKWVQPLTESSSTGDASEGNAKDASEKVAKEVYAEHANKKNVKEIEKSKELFTESLKKIFQQHKIICADRKVDKIKIIELMKKMDKAPLNDLELVKTQRENVSELNRVCKRDYNALSHFRKVVFSDKTADDGEEKSKNLIKAAKDSKKITDSDDSILRKEIVNCWAKPSNSTDSAGRSKGKPSGVRCSLRKMLGDFDQEKLLLGDCITKTDRNLEELEKIKEKMSGFNDLHKNDASEKN